MDTVLWACGSYTEIAAHVPDACGEGICLFTFDEATGVIETLSHQGGIINPSYLAWESSWKSLFAISENPDHKGEILEFKIKENSLRLVSSQTGPGLAACHLAVSAREQKAFAASYGEGSLSVYELEPQLSNPAVSHFYYQGSGPNAERQSQSHAHQVLTGPGHEYIYVSDLGSDKIWMHDLSRSDLKQGVALDVPASYGPRHMAIDPNSPFIYILCELKPRLLVTEIQEDGRLEIIQDLSSMAQNHSYNCAPAAIKIHPSGASLAVSNRFEDRIAVFSIDRSSCGSVRVHFETEFDCRGKTPRDIEFSPSGKWLLIANQDSSDIQSCAFDQDTGLPLSQWGSPYDIGTPVCLVPMI